MASRALVKAIKPESIRYGFSVIGLFSLDKRTMDSKVGAPKVYVRVPKVQGVPSSMSAPDL